MSNISLPKFKTLVNKIFKNFVIDKATHGGYTKIKIIKRQINMTILEKSKISKIIKNNPNKFGRYDHIYLVENKQREKFLGFCVPHPVDKDLTELEVANISFYKVDLQFGDIAEQSMGAIHYTYSNYEPKNKMTLDRIFVEKEYAKNGLGSALMNLFKQITLSHKQIKFTGNVDAFGHLKGQDQQLESFYNQNGIQVINGHLNGIINPMETRILDVSTVKTKVLNIPVTEQYYIEPLPLYELIK